MLTIKFNLGNAFSLNTRFTNHCLTRSSKQGQCANQHIKTCVMCSRPDRRKTTHHIATGATSIASYFGMIYCCRTLILWITSL